MESKLNAVKLEEVILQDLAENAIHSSHGISIENIHQLLIPPVAKEFINAWDKKVEEYWLVLDEVPNSKSQGYQVVYSEREQSFGLASKSNLIAQPITMGLVFGLYGSFVDALNNM